MAIGYSDITLRVGDKDATFSTRRIKEEASRKPGEAVKYHGWAAFKNFIMGTKSSGVRAKLAEIEKLHAALHSSTQLEKPDVIDSLLIFDNLQRLATEAITKHNETNSLDQKSKPVVTMTKGADDSYSLKINNYSMVEIKPKLGIQANVISLLASRLNARYFNGNPKPVYGKVEIERAMIDTIEQSLKKINQLQNSKDGIAELFGMFKISYQLSCMRKNEPTPQSFNDFIDVDNHVKNNARQAVKQGTTSDFETQKKAFLEIIDQSSYEGKIIEFTKFDETPTKGRFSYATITLNTGILKEIKRYCSKVICPAQETIPEYGEADGPVPRIEVKITKQAQKRGILKHKKPEETNTGHEKKQNVTRIQFAEETESLDEEQVVMRSEDDVTNSNIDNPEKDRPRSKQKNKADLQAIAESLNEFIAQIKKTDNNATKK